MTDKKGNTCWNVLKENATKTGDTKLLALMDAVEKAVGTYVK